MNERQDRAKSLFLNAVDIAAGAQRQAYLDAACAGDEALRREIEQLLWHHEHLNDFLDATPPEFSPTADTQPPGAAGTSIGPYKLLQQIGEGGMGVVWMAEQQEPVRRKVALKIIKPGMDSRQVLARFEAERQALALMDHQNIARVLDAGTTENDRPFFVMELIHGIPITQHCDDNQLTLRERLELFVPVCQAIQHAHQKGIIHRDVKPSNVLVTMYDGKPAPKVIDFGVAKAVEQRLTEQTLFTEYGTIIGTFEYMSPEQAEMSALGVDTRGDIYSLGVLLYELLTGTTPLERQRLRTASYAEIVRWIREEEPVKPSTRLSHSETLPAVAAARKMEPAKLAKLVRGELDWIVMKALEKDRNRRYQTANDLARDVERYLADEPVEACPPSTGYRLRKLARRHKQALAGMAAALLGLIVLASTIGYFLRERQTLQAELRQEIETALDKANELRQKGRWKEARLVLEQARGRAGTGALDLRRRLDRAYADLDLVDRLESIRLRRATLVDGRLDFDTTERDYAAVLKEAGLGEEGEDTAAAADRFRISAVREHLVAALDDWVAVTKDPQRRAWLLEVARRADPDPWCDRFRDPKAWRDGAILAALADELLRDEAQLAKQRPQIVASLATALQAEKGDAVPLLRAAQGRRPDDFWLNFQLGNALRVAKQLPEAIGYYRAAVALRPDLVVAHVNLGYVLRANKQLDDAIREVRIAIALDPQSAIAHNNLGAELGEKKQWDEAIAEHREAIRLRKDFALAHYNLGNALHAKGLRDDSIAEFREAIRFKKEYAEAHYNLAKVLREKGLLDDSIVEYREAIRLQKDFAMARYNLGNALRAKGLLDEAVAEYREAIRLKDYAEAHCNLGEVLMLQGLFRQATEEYRRGHELGSKKSHWPYPSAQWLRECERFVVLDDLLPAILSGQKQPADAAERVALAQLCQLACKKRYFAAERFYAEAFADNPQLAAAHRYDAACSAALAGCGRGDADKLDARQRARLRQQALDWLRQDLNARLRMLEQSADKAASGIARQLQHWLHDDDLAGVRGSDALARLPASERSQWRKLWEEVETLRRRSAGKPAALPARP